MSPPNTTLAALAVLYSLLFAVSTTPAQDDRRPEFQQQMISCAMSQFNLGRQFGDVEVVKAFIWAANDPARTYADAHARRVVANYAFYVACVKRFDEKTAADLIEQFGLVTPDGMMLMSVGWNIEGDAARPEKHRARFQVSLRRVLNIWRIDVTPDPAPAAMDQEAVQIRAEAETVSSIAKELTAKKIASIEQLKSKLSQAGLKSRQ